MKPIDFEGSNIVFGKDQPEYLPLPARILPEQGEVVTCWEVPDEDLAEIIRTGRIWLSQLTFGHPLQPLRLQAFKPEVLP